MLPNNITMVPRSYRLLRKEGDTIKSVWSLYDVIKDSLDNEDPTAPIHIQVGSPQLSRESKIAVTANNRIF